MLPLSINSLVKNKDGTKNALRYSPNEERALCALAPLVFLLFPEKPMVLANYVAYNSPIV